VAATCAVFTGSATLRARSADHETSNATLNAADPGACHDGATRSTDFSILKFSTAA